MFVGLSLNLNIFAFIFNFVDQVELPTLVRHNAVQNKVPHENLGSGRRDKTFQDVQLMLV